MPVPRRARRSSYAHAIILVGCRTRPTELSRLLMLLKNAGQQRLAHNVNFA